MDSEKDNEAERQAEEKRQQDVEALKRRAASVVEKLTLQKEFQNRSAAEALDRQLKCIEEALNRQVEALNLQAVELRREQDALKHRQDAGLQTTGTNQIIENVASAGNGDFQKIAANQILLGESYYRRVLQQAKYSFWLALVAACVGIVFFLVASGLIFRQIGNFSYISLISGVIVEVISGIGFFLYAHASRQLASFHVRLDRILLFLFANTVCEHIQGDLKDQTRAELVRSMARLPQWQVPSVQQQEEARMTK